MTDKEILNADLLDILFEHRNKQYGAYVLRRYYNNRMATALGISFSIVLLFVLFSMLKQDAKDSNKWNPENNDNVVKVTNVILPEEKKPEEPKPVEKKKVAQSDYQTIKIVEDDKAKEPLATIDELSKTAISDVNEDGPLPDNLNKAINNVPEPGNGAGEQPKVKEPPFDPIEIQPSFPGGASALALFFSNNINPPAGLEPGEKKVVLVKFTVNADGTVTQTEIVESSGETYEREVLRAFKRMPKWNPAIQNGHKIAFSFTQPVTFIGQEE